MNEIINWMGGWPKDGLVAASEWEERLAEAAESRRSVTENEADAGRLTDKALGEALAVDLLRWWTGGDSENVMTVSGADSAIAKLAEKVLEPGDVVLTQPLTSRFALQAFRKAGLRIEAVASDRGGMDADALSLALRRYRPKLVYAAPACSDPEGAAWDNDRAAVAADLCREFDALFLRDDRQAFLRYNNQQEEDDRLLGPGVLSIGQLPPGLIGGVKFGWITGERADLERWYPASMRSEIRMSQLERIAMARLIKELPLSPLIELLRIQCEQRMKRLTELLAQRGIPELIWHAPSGGVHLWVTLPSGLDGEALLRGAWLKGLMFQPGAPFFAVEPQRNTVRLTFQAADERQMKTGVSRFSEAIGDFVGRSV